jgi:hypothetical protein
MNGRIGQLVERVAREIYKLRGTTATMASAQRQVYDNVFGLSMKPQRRQGVFFESPISVSAHREPDLLN